MTEFSFPKNTFEYFLECNGEFDDYEEEESGTRDLPWKENVGETLYMECIYNSTNFYISFAQYLILAVVFCTGKPFKKNIFYNYGMLIFSIIGFLYAEYIVFYVDAFSRKWIYITPYPDDKLSDYYDKVNELVNINEHQYDEMIDAMSKADADSGDIEKNGDAEVLKYDNYEIACAYDDCIIRPLSK